MPGQTSVNLDELKYHPVCQTLSEIKGGKMEKIKIEKFQAISAEIEIRKLVVIIGEQASGKSTVAKLVYFFKSLGDEYIESISKNLMELNSATDLQRKFWEQISRKFYRLFGSIQHLPYFKIQYSYSDNNIITLEQGIWENDRKKLNIDFSSFLYDLAIKNIIPLIKELQKIGQDYIVRYPKIEEFNKYVNKVFNSSNHVFIPAGRNITVSYADFFQPIFYGDLSSELALLQDEDEKTIKPRFVQDTYLMMKFMQRVQILKESFKDFETLMDVEKADADYIKAVSDRIARILKGTYKNDERFGELIFFNNDDYVHLNNSSSGQQEVIRILQDIFLILLNKDNAFRIIEEPEAHLFPTAQKYLLEIITIMLNRADSQMILTTHSPYILSVINNLLFASLSNSDSDCRLNPSETSVYSLSNRQSRSVIDPETGMIDQNALDTISEELADEFEDMYDRYVAEQRKSK